MTEPILISLDDYVLTGGGANGESFDHRSDPTVMLKLYFPGKLRQALDEMQLSRKVYDAGIPTPEPGEYVVTEDGRYGMRFRRIAGKLSYSRATADHPEKVAQYATEFAQMSLQLHATHLDTSRFDNVKERYFPLLEASPSFTPAQKEHIRNFIASTPDTDTAIHGDLQYSNISFAGDEVLFNQLTTYLNEAIGKEPDMSSETLDWWEMQYTDNNQVYVGNISINLYQGMISLASHFFRGFTVTITVNPAAGGTALIYPGGSNDGVSCLTEAENSDTNLKATPADGYTFAGWYLGDTLISDKATAWDYKIPSQDVSIEARFTQLTTTTSYAEASAEFKKVTGIDLPAIADLEVDREYPYMEGDTGYCFDIIGGSALTYQSYLALETFLNGAVGDPDEGYPDGDEANGRGSRWTTETRWYSLDWYKMDNGSFMIFLNTDAISE